MQNGAALSVTGGGTTWNNNLAVDGGITVATVLVVTPPTLSFTKTNNNLQCTWAGSFMLQAQTNSLNVGLGTNWADYPGGGTSPGNGADRCDERDGLLQTHFHALVCAAVGRGWLREFGDWQCGQTCRLGRQVAGGASPQS